MKIVHFVEAMAQRFIMKGTNTYNIAESVFTHTHIHRSRPSLMGSSSAPNGEGSIVSLGYKVRSLFGIGRSAAVLLPADRRSRPAVRVADRSRQRMSRSVCSSAGRLADKWPWADFAGRTVRHRWTRTEAGTEPTRRRSTAAQPESLAARSPG